VRGGTSGSKVQERPGSEKLAFYRFSQPMESYEDQETYGN